MTKMTRTLAAALVWSAATGGAAFGQANTVAVVLPERPDNLEPCFTVNSNIGRVLSQNVVESLTRLEIAEGIVQPRLATEWSRVDDLTWRFKLAENVSFHDGAKFNAEAVVKSVDRQVNGGFSCANNAKLGGVVFSATAVDDFTVDIITSQPSAIVPSLMPLFMIVSPNTTANEAVNDPIGTGPYKLQASDNQKIVLERNKDYWGDLPEVEEATYLWRNESAVRAAMIGRGEADIAPDIAVQDTTDPEIDFPYLNSETTRVRISADVAPLDDIRVRKALNLAIDWDGMATLFGSDVIRASQLVVEGITGHNDKIQPWKFDLAEAQSLLEEASADGVPVKTPITLVGRNGIYPNGTEAMEAMMAMWEAAGFNIELTMLDVSAWVAYDQKPYPSDAGPFLLQQQHDNSTGDGYSTAYFLYHSNGQTSGLSNAAIDAKLDALSNLTDEERKNALQNVFAALHDEVISDVPMFHMVGYARVAPRVNWRPSVATNSEIMISKITFN